MIAIEWTNSKLADELAWSSITTVEEQVSITLNNALGSIGQYTEHISKAGKAGYAKYEKFN